ncbi:MAG: methionyl-tRNA formyltransferase [Gammaproteobacteria bacterium]|nr:methionyl-tRNA formyltransferase [Gammaproteobacteria bacterium]
MLKIIYAGTPEFALPALQALLQSRHQVVAVYTQPDRPAGRGRKLQASPVKACALEHAVPVFQPENFKSATDLDCLAGLQADLMIVAAYGLLLPPAVLTAPRLGCVNIHASLLPRWRGASPIQQAILAGDTHSGVTLMKMEQGLDSGDMIASRDIEIDARWSAGDLHDRLAPLGAEILMSNIDVIEDKLQNARPQDEAQVTYAPRLVKQQAQVDWQKSLAQLLREVRAFNPWPVSYSAIDGHNLRLWRAQACAQDGGGEAGVVAGHDSNGVYVQCGDGVMQITELQFAGRNRCSAAEALNARNLTGCQLGKS